MRQRSHVQNSTSYSFVAKKLLSVRTEGSLNYITTATRAPIPPATRAAACVGKVAAKFDVDELVDELVDLLDELLLPDVLLDDDPVPEDPELLLTDGIVTGTEVVMRLEDVMGMEVVMGSEVVISGTLSDDTLPVEVSDEEGVGVLSVTSKPSTKERVYDNGE